MPNSLNHGLNKIKQFKEALHAIEKRDEPVVKKILKSESDLLPGIFIKGLGRISFISYLAFQGKRDALNFILELCEAHIKYKILNEILYGYALANKQDDIEEIINSTHKTIYPNVDKLKTIHSFGELPATSPELKDMSETVFKGAIIADYFGLALRWNSHEVDTGYYSSVGGRIKIDVVVNSLTKTEPDYHLLTGLANGGHLDIIYKVIRQLPPSSAKIASTIVRNCFKNSNYPNSDEYNSITTYVAKRSNNADEYYHYFSSFFGGYSRTDKLAAANALLEVMDGRKTPDTLTPFTKILEQGELSKLYASIQPKLEFLVEPVSEKATKTMQMN